MRGLDAKDKELKESDLCFFCMRHSAKSECFGKGKSAKPACTAQNAKGSILRNCMRCSLVKPPLSMPWIMKRKKEEGRLTL
jgi:hypothetical protein